MKQKSRFSMAEPIPWNGFTIQRERSEKRFCPFSEKKWRRIKNVVGKNRLTPKFIKRHFGDLR
jgi:hypothetical protein